MPSLEAIDAFKRSFLSIGHEAEILAERGEKPVEVAAPEQGLSAELSDLLGVDSEGGAPEPAPADAAGIPEGSSVTEAEGGPDLDFASLLSGIGDDIGGADAEASSPTEDSLEMPEGDSMDFSAGLGDLMGSEASPDASGGQGSELPSDFAADASFGSFEAEPGAEPSQEPISTLDEGFSLPEDSFEIPEEEGGEPQESVAPPGKRNLAEEFGDLGGFEEESLFSEAPPEKIGSAQEEPGSGEYGRSLEELGLGDYLSGPGGQAGASAEAENLGSESVDDGFGPSGAGFDAAPTEEGSESFNFALPDEADLGEANAAAGGPEAPADDAEQDTFSLPDIEGAVGSGSDGFDSFESFSFDDELTSGAKAGEASEGFSLEGIDEGFELPSQGESKPKGPAATFDIPIPKAKPRDRSAPADDEGLEGELKLDEDELDRLQDSLLSYPRNLRLVIEELIAEEQAPRPKLNRLVMMLVKGEAIRQVASYAAKLSGKSIKIPPSFEKRTGRAFEAERGSFMWALTHNILPVAGIVLAACVALAFLGLIAYELIYKPIQAGDLYARGYSMLEERDFQGAERLFSQAKAVRSQLDWHYRYAEGYAAAKAFEPYAAGKYEEILRDFPGERKAAFDYARMQMRRKLYRTARDATGKAVGKSLGAADVIDRYILERDRTDKEGRIFLGDMHMDWAETELSRYDLPAQDREARAAELRELARKEYAIAAAAHGQSELLRSRMLLYALRDGRREEAAAIAARIYKDPPPEYGADLLAELGGMLIDAGDMDKALPILKAAADRDPSEAVARYELGRYFGATLRPREEALALDGAIRGLEADVERLWGRRLAMLILSLGARADNQVASGEVLDAKANYEKAMSIYRGALADLAIDRRPEFGSIAARLGDVHYEFTGDYDAALALYREARQSGFSTGELSYKVGYIHYFKGRLDEALGEFVSIAGPGATSASLLAALGNTLYLRGDYEAAYAAMSRLASSLEAERASIVDFDPQGRKQHAELAKRLVTSFNNLGVAERALGMRRGDASLLTNSLARFSHANYLFETYNRDQETMLESERQDLSFLNLRAAMRGGEPELYRDIPKELNDGFQRAMEHLASGA
jgi:hypothetical protein